MNVERIRAGIRSGEVKKSGNWKNQPGAWRRPVDWPVSLDPSNPIMKAERQTSNGIEG